MCSIKHMCIHIDYICVGGGGDVGSDIVNCMYGVWWQCSWSVMSFPATCCHRLHWPAE
jgi:hypothetical protein